MVSREPPAEEPAGGDTLDTPGEALDIRDCGDTSDCYGDDSGSAKEGW